MSYKIKFAQRLEKYLAKLKKQDQLLILEKIEKLEVNPTGEGVVKLKGRRSSSLYRIRAGNYRVVYTIRDEELIVLIVAIGNRKDIYKHI